MRVGIYFGARKSNGGAYQYALTMLDALKGNPGHSFVILNYSPDLPTEYHSLNNFEVIDMVKPRDNSGPKNNTPSSVKFKVGLHNLLLKLHLFSLLRTLTKISQKPVINLIKSKKIQLMIFTINAKLSFLLDIPTVVPIHDIQHRLHPEFPEVSAGLIGAEREFICSRIAKHATRIFVDSEIGMEDVQNAYHPDPKKLVILPFLPPNYLDMEISEAEMQEFFQKNNLPEKFLFYPAQLWPHKNHVNLVKAIAELKRGGEIVNLILTGTKKNEWGVLEKLNDTAQKSGIQQQISYLGYVENNEIAALYRKATAMIMPTFLGPTNIPVYEAWKMNCPVLYSDIRGCRQQAGDAALLFDPADPEDMAKKIKMIWNDENLRRNLIENGQKRLALWTEHDFRNKINATISQLGEKYGQK